jgi:O-acetyl-ADP-ribose deacetylase (regulator of RNase III)
MDVETCMLKHAKGNLLSLAEAGKFDIIVHGCNCQNTMGSGIAKQIKDRYPKAFSADQGYDLDLSGLGRYHKLGNYTLARVSSRSSNFTIVNAYTQYEYLPRGVDHFEYASFAVILQKLAHFYGNYDFGFPYIGMGLAGGDQDTIIQMLEDFTELVEAKSGSVTLVEYST